jgi:DedD protein
MAFFKFGKDKDAPVPKSSRSTGAAAAETVDELRRRAKQRLIGASVLVLIGVVGFPLLFDSQPRPIAVDIPIEIPDKAKVKPLAVPAPTPAAKPASGAEAKPAPAENAAQQAPAKVADAASLGDKEEILKPKQPLAGEKTAQAATNSVAKPVPKPKPEPAKPEAKPEAKPTAKPDDAAKAKALLDGQSAAAEQGRFIVQVGAFADVTKARETRLRVEKAGLKTYTQVVETADGKRIRVRVGPFASKADADKAASTIKGLDLPASILTL